MIGRRQEVEMPAKTGLFNKDLLSLVSKLEILRSFSVSAPDILLAEQTAEAMLDEQENIRDMVNMHHGMIHLIEFEAGMCIETA